MDPDRNEVTDPAQPAGQSEEEIVFLYLAPGLIVIVGTLLFMAVRIIPNHRIGIVEKRWSRRGSVAHGFIALNKEAGFQPNVLRGGIHFLVPFQYRIRIAPLVTIPQGKIGYVFARDGQQLEPTQTLASNTTAYDFEDVVGFLRNGGQRGPQRLILREGTYAINLVQFIVLTEEKIYGVPLSKDEEAIIHRMAELIAERDGFRPVVIKDDEDLVGIVTVHDGPSLPQGEIIAPVVGDDPAEPAVYHNKFQAPDRFLAAGGVRGRQLQVLTEGTYYINRLFATVEMIPKTVIDVGTVGVVVSYTGSSGQDVSGDTYRHGELVHRGHRGVWSEPLLPGKYAFNTYAGKVVLVPTTNFILKWIRNETGGHHYDENLTEVSLITKDAFEFSLPLSVVVHIDYEKAPLVIQRFGDIKKLVEQTLDPMVAAYFKNVGQTRTLIQVLQERSSIQQIAGKEMREKFAHYNLELEEVLLGTPSGEGGKIEAILQQLRDRQVAEEKIETYARQEAAAVKERELREAEARAAQQGHITESELNITIRTNEGKAQYQRALQEAAQIRAMAEAESEKIARLGVAKAIATDEQVRAYGGPQYQVAQEAMTQFAAAVRDARIDVVPRVVVGSGAGGQGASLIESLMALLLSERLGVSVAGDERERDPEVVALRKDIYRSINRDSS